MTPLATLADIEALEQTPLGDRALPSSTYDWISRGASHGGDRLALRYMFDARRYQSSEDVTYDELLGRVRQAANAFHAVGIGPEDVVSLLLPNVPEAFYAFFGAETAGIANPINLLLEVDTIAEIMNAAESRALVCMAPLPRTDFWAKVEALRGQVPTLRTIFRVDLARHLSAVPRLVVRGSRFGRAPRTIAGQQVLDFEDATGAQPHQELAFDRTIRPSDVASYFHTGGTTGSPKLAAHTHGNEVFDAWALTQFLGDDPELVAFCGLPLFHVNGITTTGLAPFATGGTVVLGPPQGYRADGLLDNFWAMAEHYRLNTFSAVPTVYARLLNTPIGERDISSLRFAACGAAPMPPEYFRAFEEATGLRILEGYGLTEGTCVSSLNPPDGERRVGSIGLRLPYQEMTVGVLDPSGGWVRDAAVDEIGTVLVRGPNVFPGYRQREHDKGLWVDKGDGGALWLNTGDLGRQDVDGYTWLTGRSKELIIRGGHNIDPALIEEPLVEHPAVAMAAAVGRPDAEVGELPVAYVQLHPGASVTEDELLAHARERVGERAAHPKRIEIVDEMPLTPIGKVFKPALRHAQIAEVVRRELQGVCADEEFEVTVASDSRRGDVATVRLPVAQASAAESRLAGFGFAVDVETD